MSYVKLDEKHENLARASYAHEENSIKYIEYLSKTLGSERWFAVARTQIELGFMALRKGITEKYKNSQ